MQKILIKINTKDSYKIDIDTPMLFTPRIKIFNPFI